MEPPKVNINPHREMQELIFFVENEISDPNCIYNYWPSFGSPLKMCNLFLNRCVIDEDAGFEIQDINYLTDFSDKTETEKRILKAYTSKFLWKRNMRGMDNIGKAL